MSQPHLPQNLSRYQYGTLKFISENAPTLAYLRKAHQTTLGSLAYRGYLRRMGSGETAGVFLTESGDRALMEYRQATLNERKHEFELTERCLSLLKHSRRVHQMPKSA